ncbi:hypothetical protein EDB81DRAFT_817417 [Dactylonectria macrodidyma]|uniref:Uncharacterized protein n=1 Tax=Dactylonectria macrodidyma TaxID=307937 RepID=A0A9P9IGG1_9HYPO|nr:hypothetical protein EDB81DRAFT_817417 [Dactylonectria macrodidyma]
MEYKQLPRGYAEVLENTQFALIATAYKLYSTVRNNQPWELDEPELNDRGVPVIYNIAQNLDCIRPNSCTRHRPRRYVPAIVATLPVASPPGRAKLARIES